MFLAFNNGIVATVDDIELSAERDGAAEIHVLKGLEIVNGGQTTASLHRARRKESANLGHVSVPIKIIKVGGADLAEMVASISRAANRQNAVQLADFSASGPFHQQVETLANNTWLDDGKGRWFYERARGSYLAASRRQHIARPNSRPSAPRRPSSAESGPTWLEIAGRGQRAGLIHWRVAGICRTLAGYAVGGWPGNANLHRSRQNPQSRRSKASNKLGCWRTSQCRNERIFVGGVKAALSPAAAHAVGRAHAEPQWF